MDTTLLKDFLLKSNAAGYATGEEKAWVKEKDGSTTIEFSSGDWRSHDNFFGGEPYGGRLVVFFEEKAVWMMVYYGWVAEGVDINEIYKVLREALKAMPSDAPFRGPKELKVGEFIYKNSWTGNVESYEGEEKIMRVGEDVENGKDGENSKIVYEAKYIGGLIDQRRGV